MGLYRVEINGSYHMIEEGGAMVLVLVLVLVLVWVWVWLVRIEVSMEMLTWPTIVETGKQEFRVGYWYLDFGNTTCFIFEFPLFAANRLNAEYVLSLTSENL